MKLLVLLAFLVHSACAHADELVPAEACARAAAHIDRMRAVWTKEQLEKDFNSWLETGQGFSSNEHYVLGVRALIESAYAEGPVNWTVAALPLCVRIMTEEIL